MLRTTPLLLASLLAGCAAEMSMDASVGGTFSSTSDSDAATPPPNDSGLFTEPDPEPVYWSLDGQLRVIAGEIEPSLSFLEINLWGPDVTLLCTLDVPIDAARTAALPPTDPALYAWWSIDHEAGTSLVAPDCGAWDAGSLALGFGPYEPQFDAAMDARDMLGADVYGLYLRQSPEDPVYVIGIAGTSDLLAGLDSTVVVPPIVDDQYEVHSLVLLDL